MCVWGGGGGGGGGGGEGLFTEKGAYNDSISLASDTTLIQDVRGNTAEERLFKSGSNT